jgi:hypothetical protein
LNHECSFIPGEAPRTVLSSLILAIQEADVIQIRFTLRCVLAVGALSLLSACGPRPDASSGDLRVARPDGRGGFTVESSLRRTFADGGPIDSFAIETLKSDRYLVRKGRDADGQYRTEWIRLVPGAGGLRLPPRAVWYYVCVSSECLGCRPNNDNSACECPDGGECVFGNLQDLFPGQVLRS